MSAYIPPAAFSWTHVAQTAVFTDPHRETSHSSANDSTLFSLPDRHPSLDISPELQRTEECLLAKMPLHPDRTPHIALFCPGPSKIDPWYARRLMDRIQDCSGTPSRLTVCELEFIVETELYYQGMDWGPHDVSRRVGSSGNVERLRGLDADIILVFHPNLIYNVLYDALDGNLVSGGLVLWQQDFYRDQPSCDLEDVLFLFERYFEQTFRLAQEPVAGFLVKTYYARILNSQIVSFLLQKK